MSASRLLAPLLLACALVCAVAMPLTQRGKLFTPHPKPAPAPIAAPALYSYEMVTFELADLSCSRGATGGIAFASDVCALTPASAKPQFNSLLLQNVDRTAGTYSLSLFNESPVCDDFVGYYLNGTFGEGPAACESTRYFNFQLRMANAASVPEQVAQQ